MKPSVRVGWGACGMPDRDCMWWLEWVGEAGGAQVHEASSQWPCSSRAIARGREVLSGRRVAVMVNLRGFVKRWEVIVRFVAE